MMFRYLLLKPLIFILANLNGVLKYLLGYSLHSGKCSEKIRSLKAFEYSAHRLRVLVNARPWSISEVTLDNYLLSHISYEDPRECIAKNVNVTLMNIDRDLAIFAVVGK